MSIKTTVSSKGEGTGTKARVGDVYRGVSGHLYVVLREVEGPGFPAIVWDCSREAAYTSERINDPKLYTPVRNAHITIEITS